MLFRRHRKLRALDEVRTLWSLSSYGTLVFLTECVCACVQPLFTADTCAIEPLHVWTYLFDTLMYNMWNSLPRFSLYRPTKKVLAKQKCSNFVLLLWSEQFIYIIFFLLVCHLLTEQYFLHPKKQFMTNYVNNSMSNGVSWEKCWNVREEWVLTLMRIFESVYLLWLFSMSKKVKVEKSETVFLDEKSEK